MNLSSKRDLKSLLKKHYIQPSKGLGQNFLVGKEIIKRVIEAADLKPADTVLEIGPGLGTLTLELAKKAKKVIAVEKDQKMVGILKETLKAFENVEIIQNDILKIEEKNLFSPFARHLAGSVIENYKIVANLPFYLTAPVIRKFLESKNQPKEMILLVQKEVGQRICAKPPDMNLLAVSVQIYAEAKIINYVSKKSFWPQPKVDSAIIKIVPLEIKTCNHRISLRKRNLFFKIVKAGFSQPRKQLLNNLSKKLGIGKERIKIWLSENNIQPFQRAETLTVEDWTKLTENFVSSINLLY